MSVSSFKKLEPEEYLRQHYQQGTVHILRKHLYSTKLDMITIFFLKTGFFRQNKRVYFSTLRFDKIFMMYFVENL